MPPSPSTCPRPPQILYLRYFCWLFVQIYIKVKFCLESFPALSSWCLWRSQSRTQNLSVPGRDWQYPKNHPALKPLQNTTKENKSLGSSWWLGPAQPPPAAEQGVDLNQSHSKAGSGWTGTQQREPRANLSTERPTAPLKNTIWSSFCYHRLEHVEKQLFPGADEQRASRGCSSFGAMQNTATFFLSHPPNSHTVQAQSRTFHVSQNKNWHSMQIPSSNGLVLWSRNSISKRWESSQTLHKLFKQLWR